MSVSQPLCFIVMPHGKKKDATGRSVDFDAVYERLVLPAIRAAGLEPVRADDPRSGGIVQPHTYQRLRSCEFLVADLTTASAAVYYELGVRHALCPGRTVLILAAKSAQIPLDPDQLQGIRYRVSARGLPEHEAKYRSLLTERLISAAGSEPDSPYFRLVPDPGSCADSTGALLENLGQVSDFRQRLAKARVLGGDAVREVEAQLGELQQVESGLVIDLFLSYRAVGWWNEMVALAGRMAPELASSVLVQEQLGLALSRSGKLADAEAVLRDLIYRRGASSESYGLLGRVMKDSWENAHNAGEKQLAKELLDRAIDAYLKGFECDWRDAYPGVNAVTLMELKQPPDPRRREIIPVVFYAVDQRIRSGAADYWDYSTLLELAVLAPDEARGIDALGRTLAFVRASWEPKITARNLRLIREARQRREAEVPPWTERAEAELQLAVMRGTARP
jgi:tetratricopeptide (TPR) repeat protein